MAAPSPPPTLRLRKVGCDADVALVQGCSPAARLAAQAPLPVLLSCRASASTLNMPPLLQIRCLPRCRLCTWLATRLRRTLSPMWPTPAHRRLWGAVTGCSTRRAYRSRRSTGLGENDEAGGCLSACGMHAMWQGIPTCQHGCPSMPLCCSHAWSTTLDTQPPPTTATWVPSQSALPAAQCCHAPRPGRGWAPLRLLAARHSTQRYVAQRAAACLPLPHGRRHPAGLRNRWVLSCRSWLCAAADRTPPRLVAATGWLCALSC